MTNEDFKKLTKIKINSNWNTQWTNSNKTSLHNVRKNVYENNPAANFDRKNQILITRLRIGHTLLTHQYLITKKAKPQCEECKTPVTVKHILTECPNFENERKKAKLKEKTTSEMLSTYTQCKNVILCC